MTSHILIHNYYAITSLIMLTIGSFYVCSQVYERWLSFKCSLAESNAIIKILIVILGFQIVPWRTLIDASYQIEILSIFIGMMAGFLFVEIETYLIRHSPINKPTKPLLNKAVFNPVKNILSRSQPMMPDNQIASYGSIAVSGACEEILYRGFMTILCVDLLNTYLAIICLLIINLLFALSHLSLGSIQVFSKFLLGLICLLSFICTKTIIMPILIHTTFNIVAIYKFRKIAYA